MPERSLVSTVMRVKPPPQRAAGAPPRNDPFEQDEHDDGGHGGDGRIDVVRAVHIEQHANQIDKRRDGQRRRFDKEQVDRERHAAAHEPGSVVMASSSMRLLG